jgi:hypothetical protein
MQNLGEVFLLLTAKGEMSIDLAANYVCKLKTLQLRKEFIANVDLSGFKLIKPIEESNRGIEQGIHQNRSFLCIKESVL